MIDGVLHHALEEVIEVVRPARHNSIKPLVAYSFNLFD
jgi:hypothetical protein